MMTLYYKMLLKYFYVITMYMLLSTEFHTSGNWGYNVPVHPGLSLHKSQANNYHVNMCNLHSTSKLYYALYT